MNEILKGYIKKSRSTVTECTTNSAHNQNVVCLNVL